MAWQGKASYRESPFCWVGRSVQASLLAQTNDTWETAQAAPMKASATRVARATFKSPLLEGLSASEADSVLRAGTARRFLARSVIVNQQEPATKLFLLLEGRGRFFYITPEGRKILLPWILAGEVFGAASVQRSADTYLCSTEILEDSRVLIWDTGTIRSLMARYPLLMDNLLTISRGYIDWFFAAHIGLSCYSARYRLAHALINLARAIGRSAPGGLELAITNEELASAASVTPFTASRLLSEWHRSGALTKSRGKVLVRSRERLFMTKHERFAAAS
jgi:CRP/FNR family cyclic AMP-dependent transcriptional regulator